MMIKPNALTICGAAFFFVLFEDPGAELAASVVRFRRRGERVSSAAESASGGGVR